MTWQQLHDELVDDVLATVAAVRHENAGETLYRVALEGLYHDGEQIGLPFVTVGIESRAPDDDAVGLANARWNPDDHGFYSPTPVGWTRTVGGVPVRDVVQAEASRDYEATVARLKRTLAAVALAVRESLGRPGAALADDFIVYVTDSCCGDLADALPATIPEPLRRRLFPDLFA